MVVKTRPSHSGSVHGLIEAFDFLDDSLATVIVLSPREDEVSTAHHYLASMHTLAGLAAGGKLTGAGDTVVVQTILDHARLAKQSVHRSDWHQVLTHARAALVSAPEGDPGWLPAEIPDVPAFVSPDVEASLQQNEGVKVIWIPAPRSVGARAIEAGVSAMPGQGGYMPETSLDVPE